MSDDGRRLEDAAKKLGASAGAGLDVEMTAAAVMKRLREEPSVEAVGWRRWPVLGGFAAAAAVVLAVGILTSDRVNRGGSGQVLALAPAALQELSNHELEEVFDSLTFDAPVYELATRSIDDMTVGQLEELLQTMMEE